MAITLNGWLGYGSAFSAGILAEPADASYARRPAPFGTFDQMVLVDLAPGTIGPAGVAWGVLNYIGIFDAPSGGNLLLWLPTLGSIQVAAGGSITAAAGSLRMVFPSLAGSTGVHSWPTGAVVATTADGRPVSVGVPLQLAGGVISAQTPAFGTTVMMTALPASQPAVGTGQLWNNGGMISVA